MEVPDIEVFRILQKVAKMEPLINKTVKLIDNGGLDQKIQKAVSFGISNCPFYVDNKAKKKVVGFVKWVIVVLLPLITTLLTIYFTVGFS